MAKGPITKYEFTDTQMVIVKEALSEYLKTKKNGEYNAVKKVLDSATLQQRKIWRDAESAA